MDMSKALYLLMLWGACVPLASAEGDTSRLPRPASHYERHHPDAWHRDAGLAALERGDDALAVRHFLESARHADKGSQAMLSELHAQGRGVERDPVLAYAWMDLAAERGYPLLVGKREHLWQALDAAGRARVVQVGEPLYAEYGDAVARPRMEKFLRAGLRESSGSRTGGVAGFLDVYTDVRVVDTGGTIQGTPLPRYYAARFWQPHFYFEAIDRAWNTPVQGIVEVQPIGVRK